MTAIPALPRTLGFAGLLPQAACLVAVWFGGPEWRWTALAIAWAYASLIFTFLGGMWWGLAAAPSNGRVPDWVWLAAVAPSLIALATFLPWIVGQEWPGPSLLLLGILITGSVVVDGRLRSVTPAWWMRLRLPLSLGLGALTIAIAVTALVIQR